MPLLAFETWTASAAVETGRMRTVFPAGQKMAGSSRDKTARAAGAPLRCAHIFFKKFSKVQRRLPPS
jgi:hypothetical protein